MCGQEAVIGGGPRDGDLGLGTHGSGGNITQGHSGDLWTHISEHSISPEVGTASSSVLKLKALILSEAPISDSLMYVVKR